MKPTASRRTIQDLTSLFYGGAEVLDLRGARRAICIARAVHFRAGSIHQERSQSLLRARDGSLGSSSFSALANASDFTSAELKTAENIQEKFYEGIALPDCRT